MPATTICSVCGACRCTVGSRHACNSTVCSVCSACSEAADACSPRFTAPAVPGAKPACLQLHNLQCLRCLQRSGGCLQPTVYRSCGAWGEAGMPATPQFAVFVVPAAKRRMPAAYVLRLLRCLGRSRHACNSTICSVCGACGTTFLPKRSKVRRKLDPV